MTNSANPTESVTNGHATIGDLRLAGPEAEEQKMPISKTMAVIASMAIALATNTVAQPVAVQASIPGKPAPHPATISPMLTVESALGDVINTAGGLAILQKYMPLLISSPDAKQDHILRASVHHISDYMPGFRPGTLAVMNMELGKVRSPEKSILSTPEPAPS